MKLIKTLTSASKVDEGDHVICQDRQNDKVQGRFKFDPATYLYNAGTITNEGFKI